MRLVRPRRLLVAAAFLVALAVPGLGRAADLGPNVVVFDPSMAQSAIQAKLDAIAAEQIPNEFGTQRYAVFFEPGTYGSAARPLNFRVGYYEQVAGLGASPNDVQIIGTANVNNNSQGLALTNFWRSLSNLTITPVGGSNCLDSNELWAVSQASPMRRVHVNGLLFLFDYCSGPGYASGGFIADSSTGFVINAPQQQWFTRNSNVDGWSNSVWNQVFAGVNGAPPTAFVGNGLNYTTLPTNPAEREAPFVYDTGHGLAVYVPSSQHDSSGPTWLAGQTSGRSLPLSSFDVVRPGDSVQSINKALSRGQNLLFTPGVYDIAQTIRVKRADTVVLGLGLATLTAQGGSTPLAIDDVPGVVVSGLIIDAGASNSPTLLQVGSVNEHGRGHGGFSDASDPTLLADVFFRIGGPHVGKATTALEVNSSDTILDDVWAWRADHGSGVGWTVNTSDHGLVVNGDRVVATGLFVEHFQKDEVVWNGDGGQTVFFQNEMPYDPPTQAAWQHDGILGYAAFKVADDVTTFSGYGFGSYCFFNVNPSIHASHAYEVPTTPGVQLHDVLDLTISGTGTIDHIVNDTGPPTTVPNSPNDLVAYP